MNRLILVGNGFDLAHGLKTSYCDFIRWYLAEALNTFRSEYLYEDELLTLSHKYAGEIRYPSSLPTNPNSSIQVFNYIKENNHYWKIDIKSKLLESTINRTEELNWVDIEIEYFEELSRCQKDGLFNAENVKTLNKQFTFLKEKLEEYLIFQQLDLENFIPDEDILNVFKSEFIWSDFDTNFEKGEGKNFKQLLTTNNTRLSFPSANMLLNFNYTNTTENYVAQLKKNPFHSNTVINYIHGQLNSEIHKIVFGFGDEFNSKYTQFEEQKNNNVFDHIKSYWYFKSSNYRNLVRFLNGGMFQVFIMGHSCGLSDRTMFREIFEHENCKSVKIFYYEKSDGSNDFYEKTVELGRHFTNNGKMRKKIVEFNMSSKFPQPESFNLNK